MPTRRACSGEAPCTMAEITWNADPIIVEHHPIHPGINDTANDAMSINTVLTRACSAFKPINFYQHRKDYGIRRHKERESGKNAENEEISCS
jgi:hypothetical protein